MILGDFELFDAMNHIRIEKQAKAILNHVKRSSVARIMAGSAIGYVLDRVGPAGG